MNLHFTAGVRPPRRMLPCAVLALSAALASAQSGGSVVPTGVPIPPVNDTCANATPIFVGSNAGTSTNANYEDIDQCNGGDQNVWFTFVPPANGNYSFAISGNTNPLVAGVFLGDCSNLLPLNCVNAAAAYVPALTAGQTYYVEVSDWQSSGAFSLDVATFVAPANDACANAAVANVGLNFGTAQGASYDGDFNDDCNEDDANVWLVFTPPSTGAYSFAVTSPGGNAVLASLATGTCGALSPMMCPFSSNYRIDALTAGVAYYVEIVDWQASGPFTLDIAMLTPGPGDSCTTALPAVVGSNPVDTSLATYVAAAGACNEGDANVWLTFVPPANGAYSFAVNGSGSATVASISSGSCGALSPISCAFNTVAVVDALTAGQTYYVEIADWQNSGAFTLDIAPYVRAVPGDSCSTALVATVGQNVGDSTGATLVTGGTCNGGAPNLWFAFTPPATSAYSFAMLGGTGHEIGGVYSGACGSLVSVACVEEAEGNVGALTAGVTYYVEVVDWNAAGAFTLDIAPFVPAANDDCAGATPVQVGLTLGVDNLYATRSAGVPCDVGRDLWYSFTPTCSGFYSFSTCGLSLNGNVDDTVLVLYGSCGSLPFACDDDTCGPESKVVADLVAGQTYLVRLGGYEGQRIVTGLRIEPAAAFAIAFDVAPGSVTMSIEHGTGNALYFAPLTFFAGNFPQGAFFGIDISFLDLLLQANAGPPFVGALDACGATTQGPYLGVPPGLTLYSVALDNLGSPVIRASAPVTFTTL